MSPTLLAPSSYELERFLYHHTQSLVYSRQLIGRRGWS
jgi:hypothetical protein